MGKPHKHSELIKLWAEGAEIERYDHEDKDWLDDEQPMWFEGDKYRIKPEVAQWRKDMAQALKDGKQVMCRVWWTNGVPEPTKYKASAFLDPAVKLMESDYFIKPEPKPDYISARRVFLKRCDSFGHYAEMENNALSGNPNNIKFIFDCETGALKSAEVLK